MTAATPRTPRTPPTPPAKAVGGRLGVRLRAIVMAAWFRVAVRALVGVGVLVAVVLEVGSGPFLRGLAGVDLRVIGIAAVLSAAATAAAAWRWTIVAGGLGVGLRWPTAVGAYYRSQFLNTVLPGGVAGDVRHAVAHGLDAGDVPQAARAVVIERTAGQVVQLAVTIVVLAVVGLEFAGIVFATVGVVLAGLALAVVVATVSSTRFRRALRHELDELAIGIGSPATAARIVAASIVVVGCHVGTFAVAASAVRATDAPAAPMQLLAIALVVLLAGSIPLSLGGWGPREGIAGWAFAVAGLGAATGVATSALFGILAMIALAPGLVLSAVDVVHRRRRPTATAAGHRVALTGKGRS